VRVSKIVGLVMLACLVFLMGPIFFVSVHAQTFSRVYFSNTNGTSTNCCIAPPNLLTVSVHMDLAAGETINEFDVRIDYSHWGTVLCMVCNGMTAGSIDFSGNIFDSQSHAPIAEAADGVTLTGDLGWPTDDSPSGGQVHFAEALIGTTLSGGTSGITGALLFKINFYVNGNGASLFTMDRAHLVNPGTGQAPNPRNLEVETAAGVFANTGIVPFFDFQPVVGPIILPGEAVLFDAGQGFYSASGAPINSAIANYTWDFGDGVVNKTSGSPTFQHTYASAGNYTVVLELNATSSGSSVGSFERVVSVSSTLGALDFTVTDAIGSPITKWGAAGVLLYNSSSYTNSFANQVLNAIGEVVFTGLSPGNEACLPPLVSLRNNCQTYFVKIVGPALVTSHTEQFQVMPGWTTMERKGYDAVGVSLSGGGLDTAGIIYLGIILSGIAIVSAVLLYQRRSRRKPEARKPRVGKGR
jgi:PKD domain-containing protein